MVKGKYILCNFSVQEVNPEDIRGKYIRIYNNALYTLEEIPELEFQGGKSFNS